MSINKNYEPPKIEKKWYDHWQNKGYFTPEINTDKPRNLSFRKT